MINVLKGGVATTQAKVREEKTIKCNCNGSIPSSSASGSVHAALGSCTA